MGDMRLAAMPAEGGDRSRATGEVAIDAHVGQRLRARRIALGLSQGELGRRLGLTFSQVQKYEKGVNRIGAGRLYHAASLLGVPVQYFFEGLQLLSLDPVRCEGPDEGGRAADAMRIRDVFTHIADPDARKALILLASTMTSDR
jgi:transcriptional regulator with XRE-family HTH domain